MNMGNMSAMAAGGGMGMNNVGTLGGMSNNQLSSMGNHLGS